MCPIFCCAYFYVHILFCLTFKYTRVSKQLKFCWYSFATFEMFICKCYIYIFFNLDTSKNSSYPIIFMICFHHWQIGSESLSHSNKACNDSVIFHMFIVSFFFHSIPNKCVFLFCFLHIHPKQIDNQFVLWQFFSVQLLITIEYSKKSVLIRRNYTPRELEEAKTTYKHLQTLYINLAKEGYFSNLIRATFMYVILFRYA